MGFGQFADTAVRRQAFRRRGGSPTRRFADGWFAAWRFAISAPAMYHCIMIEL